MEQVKAVSVDEQRQLRMLLDELLASSSTTPTEDEFEQMLVATGLLSVPDPQQKLDIAQYRQYQPVEIQEGPPVSETLIADRR